MKAVHLTPEEAVHAFIELNARSLLGIHWRTFDLAEEPLDEPPKRMLAEIRRRNIDPSRAWIFKIGEPARGRSKQRSAGGSIQRDKFSIGQYGFIALAIDTEGNMFGLHSMQ